MTRHILFAFAFLLFLASSATGATFTALQRMLVGDSYSMEVDDGNPQRTTIAFAWINEEDGTFRASLKLPQTAPIPISGQFTHVPEWAIPGTNFVSPEHYHLTFAVVRHIFFGVSRTTTYNGDLYAMDAEPLLTGRGSYATAGTYYYGSRAPVSFFAERVYTP